MGRGISRPILFAKVMFESSAPLIGPRPIQQATLYRFFMARVFTLGVSLATAR